MALLVALGLSMMTFLPGRSADGLVRDYIDGRINNTDIKKALHDMRLDNNNLFTKGLIANRSMIKAIDEMRKAISNFKRQHGKSLGHNTIAMLNKLNRNLTSSMDPLNKIKNTKSSRIMTRMGVPAFARAAVAPLSSAPEALVRQAIRTQRTRRYNRSHRHNGYNIGVVNSPNNNNNNNLQLTRSNGFRKK